jgi:HAD superfamily hydrolase (TIGR01509 family)
VTATDGDARPRLLSLDIWHTLLFLEPTAEEAYMRAQVDLAVALLADAPVRPGDRPRGADGFRPAFEAVYAEAVAASQQGLSVTPAAQIEEAGRRTGRLPDPRRYLQGLTDLVGQAPFRVAPGAIRILERLRATDWRTAVVSNTVGEPGRALQPILSRLGLTSLIDTFVFSDELPWTKPSPEIFREALRRLSVPSERAVHVGDGWVDIEGARRAGLRAGVLYTGLQDYGARYRQLFLPEGWAEPSTPYRIGSWEELPAVLDAIP